MRARRLLRNHILIIVISLSCLFIPPAMVNKVLADYVGWYGSRLCEDPDYYCIRFGKQVVERNVKSGRGIRQVRRLVEPTWEDAWPDPQERALVMKLNRMNYELRSGYRVAVPDNMDGKTLMDFSPFKKKMDPPGEKVLIFDPAIYAWAAYDEKGRLVRWGPAVGGRAGYRTPVGEFEVYSKGDAACRSRIYPEGCSGRQCTPMPFCMTFHQGNAFHAGKLPGRHESHGCVRLFYDDAKWLNQELVEVGTRVVVRPYHRK